MKKRFKILVRKYEPFVRVTEKFWRQYAELAGVDMNLDLIALPLPELHASIVEGNFDVAHVNTDWLTECWTDGVLEDLAPYIGKSPPQDYPEGWHNSLLILQTFDDGIAGIPFHDGPECLIYRKDLFEDQHECEMFYTEYGLKLKPPKTWDEFVRVAQFFNRPGQGMYGTLFALYPDGHNNIFDFTLQLWSRGGSLTTKNGRIVLDTPEAHEALCFYRSLINSDFIHPKSRELESIGACWTFARGEVAMMVNWFGFATMGEAVEGSNVKGKVDIGPVPSGKDREPVSLNVYYTWSVSAKSKNKEIAYDFICNAVRADNDKVLPFMGVVGCRRSTWADPDVNALINYYHRMEEIHRYASTLPRLKDWHNISEIIDAMVLDVINTDKPVTEILEQAQQQIDIL